MPTIPCGSGQAYTALLLQYGDVGVIHLLWTMDNLAFVPCTSKRCTRDHETRDYARLGEEEEIVLVLESQPKQ